MGLDLLAGLIDAPDLTSIITISWLPLFYAIVIAESPTLLTVLTSALHLINNSTISLQAALHAYINGVLPY